jgi:carnitine 3-dehydrogenase
MSHPIRKVGLLGGGVIGAGWAARAVLNGYDVTICDLDPEAARKTGEVIANAKRAWDKMLQVGLPTPGTFRIVKSIEEAADGADFIQESLPENEAVKKALLAKADAVAPAHVIIGSSTSGLLPSRLQADLKHPERFVVGHPFNPVYLMPLVEVCGGSLTSEDTKTRAAAFYTSIGMRPLICRKEIDGFIADRLMEALWREALWLVHDDVATAEEIDDAIRFGPGLRWAFMGTFLIYRIAGGEPGMRHFMAQFGPALKWPWTKLMDVPELTPELLDKIVEQSDAQAGDVGLRQYERLRDDCLVSIMQDLKAHDFGAGAVLKSYEAGLRDASAQESAGSRLDEAPLCLNRTQVRPSWIDYNGHMTEGAYLTLFGETTDLVLAELGMDPAYLAGGNSYYTVETHIMHRDQARAGQKIHCTTQILGADEKRIHLFHSLYRTDDGVLLASAEQMLLHVDSAAGKAVPVKEPVATRLRHVVRAHRSLPVPEVAGRHIAMPAPKPGQTAFV